MWRSLSLFILRFRIPILLTLTLLTGLMGYFATKVRMSYEMASAIPTDNPKYQEYQSFKKMFGEDGTMLAIGFDRENLFEKNFFDAYTAWQKQIKAIEGIDNTLSIPTAINIVKEESDTSSKLLTRSIFENRNLDSAAAEFLNLPFYRNLLYNPETHAYLTAVYIKKSFLFSRQRVKVVKDILAVTESFAKAQGIKAHYSGLPFIRTQFAESVKYEMNLILLVSLILTSIILFVFFRSFSAVLFSMLIVVAGVVWALGFLGLFAFKITILSALIAPLLVVIGLPNCIYFLNKYHTQFAIFKDKRQALLAMVERMGIVTLFTNLTAAIGFGVFYFTKSQVLKEFGLVSGLSIMAVFVISLLAIPAIFSFLEEPKEKHTRYLDNKALMSILLKLETWVMHHRRLVYAFWLVLVAVSGVGMYQLRTEGHIVDDLPKNNSIYTDLKYFEKNFNGVMPLEIVIDTRKKQGASTLGTIKKMDELSEVLRSFPEMSKPLSLVEAIKFARQAYYDGDSSSYGVPNSFDISFLLPYLKTKSDAGSSPFSRILNSFTDSTKRYARISVSMADVGSVKLPKLLDSIQARAVEIFDTSRYTITYTGTGVVFLEGSKFIISSLTESILLALVMIIFCMIFLFRSWRIVLISLITNLIPLIITAGVMGFLRIPLKPSTVLVFSIALGIAIDVTIRFLVNYKQDLPANQFLIPETVRQTIQETGISIIYTSLILSAGFVVFLVSQFDGTKALGYLTALTLFMAMITNLTILPALLVWLDRQKKV